MRLFNFRRRTDIHYVTDGAQWSFDWDARYITDGLNQISGVQAHITRDPWRLRHQLIHFGDRYAYLNGNFRQLHPSNHVFLTWFHGDPDDPNPDIQNLFAKLPHALPYLKKIVVSCEISKKVLMDCGVPEKQLVTIPLGVDLARFQPATLATRQQIRAELDIPPDTICIGSFQKDGKGWGDGMEAKPVKGPDVFLQVIENLKARYPNLMVVLTGPARGYVKNGLEKIGVRYVHRFLEDYQQIGRYYHALDLYLIASRSEGGPKALLESWASGVPIISTKVGMPADLIQPGQNGLLAAVEDVKALTDHAIMLIDKPDLRESLRQQGLKSAQIFDWQQIAAQYHQNLYRPFLEAK